MPGGEVRLLEERPGSGRLAAFGDRVRVDFVGRYASGEVWGEGPLTFVVGPGSYPESGQPPRLGTQIKMQYLNDPNDTTVRLAPFPGDDFENEAYQVRRDRGPIIVEHTIRAACRPLKLYFLQTGFGPIELGLGCWPIPRFGPRRFGPGQSERERRGAEIEAGLEPPPANGAGLDPPPIPRPEADRARYLDEGGLHRAVREGRPELVGWLLAQGRDVAAPDSFGFLPMHYAGWAQLELERFVPAFEPSYLDVVDTLLAHGAAVDAVVQPAPPPASSMQARDHEGQTALGFAAPECADRLVRRLLERGARPDAVANGGSPAITGAARNGCPETVALLLASGAAVDLDPQGGGTPLERLIAVSAFHRGHLEVARLLVGAGARREVAAKRLADRLRDPGTGGFGFSNRPMARRILKLLRD
ncbi:MAG: ankyrin repeat domain-containing protein [Gemmatimonadales bacterium]